jgi:hypothetical protein
MNYTSEQVFALTSSITVKAEALGRLQFHCDHGTGSRSFRVATPGADLYIHAKSRHELEAVAERLLALAEAWRVLEDERLSTARHLLNESIIDNLF